MPQFMRRHLTQNTDREVSSAIESMVPSIITQSEQRQLAVDYGCRVYRCERTLGATDEEARAVVQRAFEELQEDMGAQHGMGQ